MPVGNCTPYLHRNLYSHSMINGLGKDMISIRIYPRQFAHTVGNTVKYISC